MPKRDRKVDAEGNKLVYGLEFYRVSGKNCIVCGNPGWWAHHVVPVGRGGEDEGNLVPLCVMHHAEVEQIGSKTFSEKYDVDLKEEARRVLARRRSKK